MQTIRKPLTARSVLASVLLGTEPPWLPTARLVRSAELFGITEATARTALSRMSAAGEVLARDGGYELQGRLRARQERQRESRRGETKPWDGTWELAVVGPGRRSAGERAALRQALGALRLAELREGVWTRPANLAAPHPDARAVADGQVAWWQRARPEVQPDVVALWDLDGWAATAAELSAEMGELLPALAGGQKEALAPGFVTSAAVLRHLQADPLLPPPLLPAGWPGASLRRAYDRFDAAYRSLLREWFTRTATAPPPPWPR